LDWIRNNVAYSSSLSRWVGVGSGTNSIAYSNDNGLTWTGIGTSIFTSGLRVTYSSSLTRWVAVGSGISNTIAYSTDGISWIGLGNSIFSTSGRGIAFSLTLNIWVAVGISNGNGNSIAYSTDGINWSGVINSSSIFGTSFGVDSTIGGYGVVWGGNKFVAVGRGNNSLAYSLDGINWIPLGGTNILNGNSIVYNNNSGKWIAGGTGNNTIAYSDDGLTWYGGSSYLCTTNIYDIGYYNGLFVAVGNGSSTLGYSYDGLSWVSIGNSNISYSNDMGLTWTGVQCSAQLLANAYTVCYNGTKWVGGGTGNVFSYSNNGISWGNFNQWFTGGIIWIAEKSMFVATIYSQRGTQQLITRSSDGINWILCDTGSNNTCTFDGQCITYSSLLNKFIAFGGASGTNKSSQSSWLYSSNDGINWTSSILPYSSGSPIWISELNKFVVVGGNRVLTSSDGVVWNYSVIPKISSIFQAVWSPYLQKICAIASNNGKNSVMVSSNGTDWTFGDIPAGQFYTVEWSPLLKIFCSVAYSTGFNQCIISVDGLNWYTSNILNTTNLFRILCWSPDLQAFCAVGRPSTTISGIFISELIP